MSERILPAHNDYTVYVEQISLHSRYNPLEEAKKYIDSLNIEKTYDYFILIEPGLPYLSTALIHKYPQSQVIALHCSSFFSEANPLIPSDLWESFTPVPNWNPSCKESLEAFLDNTILDGDASGIKLIEWKPSINAYGKTCVELAARTVECIRRITANKKTVKNFGRRWLRNALRNLSMPHNVVEIPCQTNKTTLVCASGPGLEDSLNTIAAWRQRANDTLLIAVSSAAPALLYLNIIPDIIIATDGGSWALFHLYECIRAYNQCRDRGGIGNTPPLLAASLTAALPSLAIDWPIVYLSDGSLWQERLLAACNAPFIRFPQRGTVSAAALDLALYASGGDIFLCGLDLSHRDLKTHARPYAFDSLFYTASFRYKPFYAQIFERENFINKSGSLGIYASWFKTHLKTLPQRIYALGTTSLELPCSELPISVNQNSINRGVTQQWQTGACPPINNFLTIRRALARPYTEKNKEFVPKLCVSPRSPRPLRLINIINHGVSRRDIKNLKKQELLALLMDSLTDNVSSKQITLELGELLVKDFSRQDGSLSDKVKKELEFVYNVDTL